MAVARYGSW